MTHPLLEALQVNEAQFIALRRRFHQQPEIGFEEHQTSSEVARLLGEWGYEVHRGLAGTGVVGTLRVGEGKKRLGLRADMDALPMQERSGKPWASQVEGRFHGCGHDGHTTTLLYAAEYLARTRQFTGTLQLIFQPAEELLYGGRVMVEDGLFDQFPCDAIFGLHNMPGQPLGKIGLRDGAMMASSDTLHIEVKGVGGHGAVPEHTVDATLVACLTRLFYSSHFDKSMKVGASVVCARRGGCSATFDELNKFFTIAGMPVASSQYWNSIHGRAPGEAEQDEEGRQTMRTLARNMTFLMRSIALGREKYGLPQREAPIRTNFIK